MIIPKIEPILIIPNIPQRYSPIEIRPSFRTITIRDGGKKRIRLAFPYMQFFFTLGIPMVTWSMKSVSSLDDKVAIPLLPNVSYYGSICISECKSSIELCEKFWNSVFVPSEMAAYYKLFIDKTYGLTRGSSTQSFLYKSTLKSFEYWAEKSTKTSDPLSVFKGYSGHPFRFDNFMHDPATVIFNGHSKGKKRKRMM